MSSQTAEITREGDRFKVTSSDGTKNYYVTPVSCTCPSWVYRGGECKHMKAVSLMCPVPTSKPFIGDPFAPWDGEAR